MPRLAHTVTALATSLLLSSLAAAEPIAVSMVTHVPVGKKPTLTIKATTRVVDVVVDLTRVEDEHKQVERYPSMSAGQSKTIVVGDGALGAQHWDCTVSLKLPSGEEWSSGLTLDTMVTSEIKVGYQREHLFLDKHILEFQISRPARGLEAELTVIGNEGETIGEGKQTFESAPAGKWLSIAWEPTSESTVMKMKLHIADPGGWCDEVLTPWTVSIPHEEVNFATNSSDIAESERPKLDAAYDAIVAEVEKATRLEVRCSLFISGHTDTVGSRDKNQKLSVDRAKSIAGYFRKKGLTIKVSYEGFGEDRPKVRTPDETDEPQNRRADYVLSAEGPPSVGQTFKWKEVK